MLRNERQGIDKQFYDLCIQILDELNLELYDMDFNPVAKELIVFISDKETGTALIEDCMKVDRAFTPYIEELDWMPEELRLEVSSPGVFRNLTSVEHLKSAFGEHIDIQLSKKLDKEDFEQGLPRTLQGTKKIRVLLVGMNEKKIQVEVNDFKFELSTENIKKAQLSPDMQR